MALEVTWRSDLNTHGPHSWYKAFSLPACISGFMGNTLHKMTQEEQIQAGFTMVLHNLRDHLKVDSYSTAAPFWDILNIRDEGKSSSWTEFWPLYLVVQFAQMDKMVEVCLHTDSWNVANRFLDGKHLGRNMIIKLVTTQFEKEVCGQSSLNGQKLWR